MKKPAAPLALLLENRKARFHYEILDTLECGIALKGTEVKSLRARRFSFNDSYVRITKGELFLVGFHISPYPSDTGETGRAIVFCVSILIFPCFDMNSIRSPSTRASWIL